jgi:hypothetical protein
MKKSSLGKKTVESPSELKPLSSIQHSKGWQIQRIRAAAKPSAEKEVRQVRKMRSQDLPRKRSASFNNGAMAKKKTTKPTKVPKSTATHSPRKATAKPVDTAVERVLETDNAPTASQERQRLEVPRQAGELSGIEIGHVAGQVWGALSGNGPLTIAALKKEVQAPGDIVAAAIGWLAREDKLDFTTAGRVVRISLR